MTRDPRLLGGDDLLGRLERWVSDARTDEAAAARTRERWLRQAADETATFSGILLDLAERSAPVVIVGHDGRRHRGVVSAIAADFCVVRTPAAREVLLALAGVSSVRIDGGATAPTGDRVVKVDLSLAEALAAIAGDRPRVLVVTAGGAEGVAGELRSVGLDVLTLRLDGDPPSTVYVPISSIVEVSLG